MINNIYSHSEHIVVTGGSNTAPWINMSNASAGITRYNGTSQSLEIYDGSSWIALSNSPAGVDLGYKTKEILRWAEEKMNAERAIMEVIKDNPTVADAYRAMKEAEEKLIMVMTLSQEESK